MRNLWPFAKDVGYYWLGLVSVGGGIVFFFGLDLTWWPAPALMVATGETIIILGAFSAYNKLRNLIHEEADPAVQLTFSIPYVPRLGGIEGQRSVLFEDVRVTNHSEQTQIIRAELILKEITIGKSGRRHDEARFKSDTQFQAFYQQHPNLHPTYLSNPMHLEPRSNEQGNLAFLLPDSHSSPIPDQQLHNFRLRFVDEHEQKQCVIETPGRYRVGEAND